MKLKHLLGIAFVTVVGVFVAYQLLNKKETTIPTKHKKILVAKVREYDYQEVAEQIEALIQLATTGKVFPTVKLMKQIVPELKSKNSVYEELDA